MVSHRPEFFDGRVLHWRMVSDVMLGEIVYVPGAVRETHIHERACLHLNLQGRYIERIGSRVVDCTELAVAFQPAGHEHSYRCHNVATRSFTVEFEKAWLDRLQELAFRPGPSSLQIAGSSTLRCGFTLSTASPTVHRHSLSRAYFWRFWRSPPAGGGVLALSVRNHTGSRG
ncbi:MAG: AraC family ligand binding domain-containing protein [Acidobacteriia bacterium]|nr:AraC family ligand binding domain-containing protein [Terriglobia bacterium]